MGLQGRRGLRRVADLEVDVRHAGVEGELFAEGICGEEGGEVSWVGMRGEEEEEEERKVGG